MKTRITVCFFLPLIAVVSCTLVVDVDVPISEPKITVNSLFSPDSVWDVSLALSRNILDESPFLTPNVSEVVILEETERVISTLVQAKPGVYRSDCKPEMGKTYSIRVSAPNQHSITATGKVPGPVDVLHVKIDTLDGNQDFGPGQSIAIEVELYDPANEVNFYRFQLYIRSVYEYFRYDTQETVRDTTIIQLGLLEDSPDLLGEGDSNFIISDSKFNGSITKIKFQPVYPWSVEIIEVGILAQNLSEEYNEYLKTLNLQRSTDGDPFAQPVKVYSNINNGFGIFAGYSAAYFRIN